MTNGSTDSAVLKAQREFDVIQDVLLTPLKQDVSSQALPTRRKWRGGCLPPVGKPDLVPVNPNPAAGEAGFCKRDQGGKLLITVTNQGIEDAPSSTTRVDFFSGGTFDLLTPSIPAGKSVELGVIIPEVCMEQEGGCIFQIIVDANNQVDEFAETNNTARGRCNTFTG